MTQSTPGSATPPGWYPDPSDPRLVRWWDGRAWTANQAPAQFQAPGQFQVPVQQPRPQLSPETPVYNPFIWAITLLPLLSILLLLTWQPEFRMITTRQGVTTMDPFSMYTPGYFLLMGASFLSYGLSVFFAFLDRQRLLKSGVVRPFHWAWAFLSALVYVIGRSVIVRKVAPNRGLWPVWATIAVFVISMVITGIWMSNFMQSVYSQLGYSVQT
ncbi:DUF2510 domain-containing protein [Paenarthrobacter sp. MSM-2-10-13]|uniref:DUF2510 domain-containing protein n=1 Tax=unclassified Paenarthrobacter TaxID=2634190 RepID=UPI0014210C18|nr:MULTISPECIES: DUF2510 domain-containing protein [unclassified Paenarthrobacter]MCM0618606.1 DUF2510 domain-containing protein [Paenarthrobacter sp. TYUT067]NHW47352.1 DUF2510 domain-containing protein [Paenarthrobacter sp. MSM-2-10-13]